MRKHYILLWILVLIGLGLAAFAIYKYNDVPKGVTIQQIQAQRDTALLNLKSQKLLNANDQQAITNLSLDKNVLATEKTTLCGQIRAARLVQPLCQ